MQCLSSSAGGVAPRPTRRGMTTTMSYFRSVSFLFVDPLSLVLLCEHMLQCTMREGWWNPSLLSDNLFIPRPKDTQSARDNWADLELPVCYPCVCPLLAWSSSCRLGTIIWFEASFTASWIPGSCHQRNSSGGIQSSSLIFLRAPCITGRASCITVFLQDHTRASKSAKPLNKVQSVQNLAHRLMFTCATTATLWSFYFWPP